MKISSYLMSCAIDASDWNQLGEIMTQHYSSPAIYELCRSRPPVLHNMNNDVIDPAYAASVIVDSIIYTWYRDSGFSLPLSVYPKKDAFNLFFRRNRIA